MKDESILQIMIVEYLSIIAVKNNFLFFSIPNEGFMLSSGKKDFALNVTLKKMGMTPGIPDLCIIKNGKAHFLECKTEIGKQSKIQIIIEKKIKDCQSTYDIVRSIIDVKKVLEKYEIIDDRK